MRRFTRGSWGDAITQPRGSHRDGLPYCSIQSAADAAQPGDTVSISGGHNEDVTITDSGTAAAPITFTSTSGIAGISGINQSSAITISGASHLNFENLWVFDGSAATVLVENSSNINLDAMYFQSIAGSASAFSQHVTGSSSAVTAERDFFLESRTPTAVLVDGARS